MVNKYSCPSCKQESSRRFNMEVHIKRKHRGIGLPLHNLYGTFHSAAFNNPHHNLGPTHIAGSNMMANNQANFDDSSGEYGFSDRLLNHLREAVEFKNLMGQLMTPYSQQPSAQQFYSPNSYNQYQWMWPNLPYASFHQWYSPRPTSRSHISTHESFRNSHQLSDCESNAQNEPVQLMSLSGLVCDKCLIVDIIPTCLYKDGVYRKFRVHSCESDRVLDVQQKNKLEILWRFVIMQSKLPNILSAMVRKCNDPTAKCHLAFKKYDNLPSTLAEDYNIGSSEYPLRILDTVDQHEYPWIDRIKKSRMEEGLIPLESNDELLSVLKITMDSTLALLKVERDVALSGSPAGYDYYAIGLLMPLFNLQKINTQFIPKLPS